MRTCARTHALTRAHTLTQTHSRIKASHCWLQTECSTGARAAGKHANEPLHFTKLRQLLQQSIATMLKACAVYCNNFSGTSRRCIHRRWRRLQPAVRARPTPTRSISNWVAVSYFACPLHDCVNAAAAVERTCCTVIMNHKTIIFNSVKNCI